jgi:hypothetical protein
VDQRREDRRRDACRENRCEINTVHSQVPVCMMKLHTNLKGIARLKSNCRLRCDL